MARYLGLAPSAIAAITCWMITAALAAAGVALYAAAQRPDVYSPWDWVLTPFTRVLLGIAFATVGATVAIRRSRNVTGWLFLAAGMLLNLSVAAQFYAAYAVFVAPGSLPAGEFVAWVFKWSMVPIFGVVGVLLPFVFPNGRLASRRWRPMLWLSVTVLVLLAAAYAFGPEPVHLNWKHKYFVANPFPLGMPPGLGGSGTLWHQLEQVAAVPIATLMLIAAASLVARARSADPLERQQVKLVALAAALPGIGMTIAFVAGLWQLGMIVATIGFFAIPIAAGMAMFRYRLYDVDIVIRRTLTYGALTAAIAGMYLVLIVLFQAAFRPLTSGSEIAVAGSTLVTLALVHPFRRRIQDTVDRHFYRSRYDSARIVDALTVRLRDEVALDAVRRDLLAAVDASVRPAHATVWLRSRVG